MRWPGCSCTSFTNRITASRKTRIKLTGFVGFDGDRGETGDNLNRKENEKSTGDGRKVVSILLAQKDQIKSCPVQ